MFIGVLLYVRLGVLSLLTFLFAAGLLSVFAFKLGVRANVMSPGHWLATVVVLIIAERFFNEIPSQTNS